MDAGVDESELARRADAGDPHAQFEHARTILGGPRASVEGPRAIALIDAAAEQGHAGALAMCALFAAMGAARPQSWRAAFGLLQRAADSGSATAQSQLLVLSDTGTLSIERLLQPPARRVLSERPLIAAFPGFAKEAECKWVIDRARGRLEPAKVFHKRTGDQTYDSVRDNSCIEFQLPDMDLVLEVLRARIAAAIRLPVPIFEPTQVLHYSVGEQFRPHHDFLDPDIPGFAEQLRLYGQRIATVLVYLNDDYSGGATVFPRIGISYRGGAGDALFFANVDRGGRADRMTMHAGTPPSAGEKWVISQWIRDRAPTSPFAGRASAD